MRFRKYKRIAGLALTATMAIGVSQIVTVADALAHTCVSNWCSGSDSSTPNNTQGNSDQIYNGEVGVYYADMGGNQGPCPSDPNPDGACFNVTAANNAMTRFNAAPPTGMGVFFYYLAGGSGSEYAPNYPSPYCFGWWQGYYSVTDAANYFSSYYSSAWIMSIDIENGYGWQSSYGGAWSQAANRQVFNGFTDYVAGRTSADSACPGYNNTITYQYGVYSSPPMWSTAFGSYGGIPDTEVWTYEYCCTSVWPGSFNNAQWFGGSNYNIQWQFDQNPDYDVLYEPIYLPVFGTYIGS
ncbi:MAG: hypothetical protein ACYDGY_10815 [Acidimicrobiales bacterium]